MIITDVTTWAVANPPPHKGGHLLDLPQADDRQRHNQATVKCMAYPSPQDRLFLILEGIETCGGFFSQILNRPIPWEEGYVIVPDEPGLGFELNEDLLDANPYGDGGAFPPMAEAPIF